MSSHISDPVRTFNLKSAIADNRLVGMWRIMYGYRMRYSAAILALGVGAMMQTATLLLIRFMVDQVLPAERLTAGEVPLAEFSFFTTQVMPSQVIRLTDALLLIAVGFVGLALMRGSFTFVSGALAAHTSEQLAKRLRDYLYDHLQRLSFAYHDRQPTGDLIQRCSSDVDAVRRFFAEQFIGIGRIVLLFVVNFIALLALHWQLALFSVIVVPVLVVISLFFFRRVSKAFDEFQQQEAIVSTTLQENLSGVRVVKAFARQEYEKDKFERENFEHFRRGRRFMAMHSVYWPISDILTGVQMLSGFFIGALLVIDGQMTVGTYMAYVGIIIWIIYPMRDLGRIIVQMSTGLVALDRVLEIIKQERVHLGKDEKPPVQAVEGNVSFRGVGFEYEEEGKPVLRDISFDVPAGKTVALLGSTGSGKTSLTALLPRFYDYTEGSITIDGVELRDYPRYFLRQNIGIVEQEAFLFSRTIRENIRYGVGRSVTEEELIEAAKAAAVHDVIMTFPDGYDTLVGERGVTLSGGQKQRVALARTLLKNPRILILDDATSAVDTETESQIREALHRLMQNRTSFIIAHRVQSVMNADLILVMDKGRIVERGTHEELMEQDGVYRRIYEMQSRIEDELEREISGVGL